MVVTFGSGLKYLIRLRSSWKGWNNWGGAFWKWILRLSCRHSTHMKYIKYKMIHYTCTWHMCILSFFTVRGSMSSQVHITNILDINYDRLLPSDPIVNAESPLIYGSTISLCQKVWHRQESILVADCVPLCDIFSYFLIFYYSFYEYFEMNLDTSNFSNKFCFVSI